MAGIKSRWQIITDRQSKMELRNAQMDKSRDRIYQVDYALPNFNGKPIKNAINVTGNGAVVLFEAIKSDLLGAKWQTVVEGEVSNRQAHLIEQFIEDNLEEADEYLLNSFGITSLHAWLCNHVCARSFIGVRWLSLIEKGQYKVDCWPVDMRWTPYVRMKGGLKWVAPVVFTNSEELIAEYPKAEIAEGNNIEVREYWDSLKHEVLVSEKVIFEEKNSTGSVPFVIAQPPSGAMLRDKGYLEHEAPDIFWLNSKLYDELNRSLSIAQSLAFQSLFQAMEYETENYDSEPPVTPPGPGEVKKVRKGERHVPIPQPELNQAAMVTRQDLMKMIREGGVNDIDLGNISQAVSSIWITAQAEIREKLRGPRLEALQVMRQGLAKLMIRQFINSDRSASGLLLGLTGKKNRYSASNLGDPDKYLIRCELRISDKKQEIANLAQFEASKDLPLKFRLTNILKADDPAGIMRELEVEEARKADPAIALHEMALRYVEEAEDMQDEDEANAKLIQAKMLMERGVALIRARQQPVQPALPEKARVPQVEQPKGGGNLLPALLGGMNKGGNGGQPQQTQEAIAQ